MYACMEDDMKMEWAELFIGDLAGKYDGDGGVEMKTLLDFIKAYELVPRFMEDMDGGFIGAQLWTPWDAFIDTSLEIITVQLKNEWVTLQLPPHAEWKHDLKDFYFQMWFDSRNFDDCEQEDAHAA